MKKEVQSTLQTKQVEETGPRLLIKKWLSTEDLCWILDISKRTAQNYRDQRKLPFYQVGRKIYYKNSDVDEFIEVHHIKSSYQKGGAA